MGCPKSCTEQKKIDVIFNNDLLTDCRDASLNELINGTDWKGHWAAYWENYRDVVLRSWADAAREVMAQGVVSALTWGCDIMADDRGFPIDILCDAQVDKAGAWMWCPRACGRCSREGGELVVFGGRGEGSVEDTDFWWHSFWRSDPFKEGEETFDSR
jgi:hypothetical protein